MNQTKAEYYKSLPAKRMGAGVLFFNDQNELLLVQPTYKDTWEIPGGIVELSESPRDAVLREVHEELGLKIEPELLNFTCIEYMSAGKEISESLMFVFSGGVLTENIINQINLESSELKSFKFVPPSSITEFLGPILGSRIIKCLESSSCFYSENKY